MKDNNKELDFGIMENADISELESLSEKVAPTGSVEKKKILEMSRRKYDIKMSQDTASDEDTVSGSEPYRPRTMWKILASAAACIAIIGGIAGGASLIKKHKNEPDAVFSPSPTTAVEATSPMTDAEIITQHEVFFRRGDSENGEIILTGENIAGAVVNYLPVDVEATEMVYAVKCTLDSEGTELFAKATEELAGTDTPISIWVDGECVYSPIVTSAISNGELLIQGNFDAETAQALAEKLSNGNGGYGLTSDGIKYGNDHAELITQCMDEFIDNADDSITDAYYCEYDINGDDIPELFIQYYTNDPEYSGSICQLYSLQGESYQKLDISSRNIQVHHNNKDGIIITQSLEDCDKNLIYQLNNDGSITLLYDFRIAVENQTVIHTINGEKYTAEDWDKKLTEITTDDVEWLDELTKDFYHHN